MVPSKYRVSLRKKMNAEFDVVVRSLSTENDYLKKMLVESNHHYSALNKLVERFLTLETLRLEGSHQLKSKDKKIAVLSEQLSEADDNQVEGVSKRMRRIISSYSSETEELKNKLGSAPDEQALADDIRQLRYNLKDALKKNKQWLEYDQQSEAYVRAILARELWLEKQLNAASRACLQQHNEHHSDDEVQISLMQEHYESLLQEAKDNLEVLGYKFGETSQKLIQTQNSYREMEEKVEELRQQLQTLKISREGSTDDHSRSESGEEQQRCETEDLRRSLHEEKCKSAYLERKADMCERAFKDVYKADQQKIADLKREVKISHQDLEDERQDCLYLRKQVVKLLKMRGQQDRNPYEVATRDSLQSSPNSSLQDESSLECPVCESPYPVHQYRDWIKHLEACHD
ncbi:centrosomal protein of 55 kDa-like isoform X2 [Notolabrus celidotus]|uniref:centrosomal protein of 55 kDa-like isoform X2 n=1 Tax=Notolabrus celidotus TaxID=1203425 RepID=UPI00148F6D8B|nr:centrosomal protein of 55 kDa-like isoform X2 [Notolabrus celidotus]